MSPLYRKKYRKLEKEQNKGRTDEARYESTERTKTMDDKKMILFISDKIGIAAALVRTAGIAVGNREVFLEDGQALAITLEAAGAELRRCRNVAEAYLQKKQQE